MIKGLMVFFLTLALLSGVGLYFGIKHPYSKLQQEELQDNSVEQAVASYLHGWNMCAYINGSMVSFHGNKDLTDVYILTVVNVEAEGLEGEYVKLIKNISKEWEEITESKIVRFINTEGITRMWTDKKGNVHTISIIQKNKYI